ncbi:MAG: tRNA uridine-5-carboxymethylaminomethyl(34) synthesis GTPase MnmE [Alicyclobacillaceae bacterium]|nr:tRNA uridine-5-carboxymethylaminomethyl(34) synthesis GTPase MnmE [Alicyclobacillaceae bacterium]
MEWDTIAAIATALGEASVGIVRVSGPEAVVVGNRVFRGGRNLAEAPSHRMMYGRVVDPDTEETLDEVLAVVMRGPHSYTGEDVVEIHGHGGPVVMHRVLEAVLRAGARLAEPGEFTKRAFLHGRLDLSQAEAVIDLIRAKSDLARKMALEQMNGSLSSRIRQMRQQLLELMAHIEVTIDYPEHDVEEVTASRVKETANRVTGEIDRLLRDARSGRVLREGVETAIIGKPNVGKSSLLNVLSRSQRAIVTDIPGTTRDVLEEFIQVRGVPLHILDTAGIRETEDVVERIGVERSREWMKRADLVLLVLDGSRPLEPVDLDLLEELRGGPVLVVVNKCDLPRHIDMGVVEQKVPRERVVEIAAAKEVGIDELEERMVHLVLGGEVHTREPSYVSNVRHIELLQKARDHLMAAATAAEEGWTLDVIAVDLQEAWERLGEIIGETAGEQLLDQIFSQFCLGK